MNRNEQRQAQQRVERIAAFRAELAELEGEQALTLTPEQRTKLETHLDQLLARLAGQFGIDVSDSAKRISWGMRIASFLGGVAFFAALVLFLHRIWGALPLGAQVGLLIALPLLFLGAAECLSRRNVDRYYTTLLALAAGVSFVMGLGASGAILNTMPSPHALLAWAAFALLLAYAYDLRLLLGAGVLLICGYAAALAVDVSGGFWANWFDRAGFLIPPALLGYALPSLRRHRDPHDFDFVYRFCGAVAVFIGLLVFSQQGDPCCSRLPVRARETIFQLLGLIAAAGVVAHGLRLGRGGLVNLGAAGFVVFLFLRLHAWWWDWMPKYLFFFVIGLIAVGLLLLFRRMRLRLTEKASP